MDFAQPITNNLKKFVSSLKNKKDREESGFFIVEGSKLVSELLNSGFRTEMILMRSNPKEESTELASEFYKQGVPVYLVRKQQFDQICDTVSPQDIIAVADINETGKEINDNFIALDGINDPGNLGTIIRTADWFGFKNIVLGENCTDKYNSKVVRATMGSLFRMNIIQVKSLASFLKSKKEFEIYGATLEAQKELKAFEPKNNFALVFGSEAHGISEQVRKCLTNEFIIPGTGDAESLNVAVSAGISLYHFSAFATH